jgi:CheY-like chemotaxis protein
MSLADADAKTILLVDDNAQILSTTAAYLSARGMRVVTSESALGVSALVRRHQPAVIVLDVMMPALDGDALAALLQGQPNARATPIIFYSAMEEEQLHRLSLRMPGTSYMPKADGLAALHSAIMARL